MSILSVLYGISALDIGFLIYGYSVCDEKISVISLYFYPPFASIAKGEVFVLLYVFLFFCFFVCSVNDFSATRGPIHAKVRMRTYSGSGRVFSPFGGWRPPAGGKRGK